jgi:butyrate kinase
VPDENGRILVINPGSTSTKIAVYRRQGSEFQHTIRHSSDELQRFGAVLQQRDYRAGRICEELAKAGYDAHAFAAVAGRGGLLPPLPSGTFLVDDAMLEELRLARHGEHASNLGAVLADWFAKRAGVNAYVVDPVSVDEWQPCARISGSVLLPRSAQCHALNTKAVARRFATEQQRAYEDLRLIVVHLGSGNSVSAHLGGRMIDNNTGEDGPFGIDRSGALPVRPLIDLCFNSGLTRKQLNDKVFGEGGVYSYLGTRDLTEVERRIDAGDTKAAEILDAMIYQVAKEAGAMAVTLKGEIDAILITGGMANSERVVTKLSEYLRWISPIKIYPGENEMQSLAEGVFRVLDGLEPAKRLACGEPVHEQG